MADLQLRMIERILAVVACSLREMFPDDFYKRCAYAVSGILGLLEDEGFTGEVVGGDFAAFIMSIGADRAGVQGFSFGEEQCSHFWVEAGGRLIDLGPFFLPYDSSYPVVAMPALAWDLSSPRPASLRYRELARFPQSTPLSPDSTVIERGKTFVRLVRTRYGEQPALKFPTWIVTGRPSLEIAANRGNPWAQGAKKFEAVAHLNTHLPF